MGQRSKIRDEQNMMSAANISDDDQVLQMLPGQSSASLIILDQGQLSSIELPGIRESDTVIPIASFDQTSSGVVSTSSQANKQYKEEIAHKQRRIKKSQALIQSKIASQPTSVQSSVQQPLMNLQLSQPSTKEQSKNADTNSHAIKKRMISLQSERIASDAAVVPEIGGGVTINSGANSKTTDRVITSDARKVESAEDIEFGQVHGSTFDERDRAGVALLEGADARDITLEQNQSLSAVIQSPVKPSHKLQKASVRKKGNVTSIITAQQNTYPTQNSSRSAVPEENQNSLPADYTSASINKASLKPLILQKSGASGAQQISSTSQGVGQQKQQTIERQKLNLIAENQTSSPTHVENLVSTTSGQNSGTSGGRQMKSIRNSFNNFFVTSKQQQNENQIKFRMSSVEHRNELKNYLELASLAGDQSINDQGSSKDMTHYKRANPLIQNEIKSVDPRRLTNGFEAARKQNNNSQLQQLKNANAQMMPSLQNIAGMRNTNNRTTINQQHSASFVPKDTSQTRNAADSKLQNKPKKDKNIQQSETYRIIPNAPQTIQQQQSASGVGSTTSSKIALPGTKPKFLPNRQSPGALSQLSKQYTDTTMTSSMPQQPIVGFSTTVPNEENAGHNLQSSYIGHPKLPAKFINMKSSMFNKAQPVRARTNLDKYEDMLPLSLQQQQSHQNSNEYRGAEALGSLSGPSTNSHAMVSAQSSSVTTIPTLTDGNFNGAQQNTLTQHPQEKQIQSIIQTPNTGGISNRKMSSQLVRSLHNSNKKPQKQQSKQKVNYAAGPYTQSANVTLDVQEQSSMQAGSKKNKFQLYSSKMVLEPLAMSNSINASQPQPEQSVSSAAQNNNKRTLIRPQQPAIHKYQQAPGTSHEKEKSYVMLPATKLPVGGSKLSSRGAAKAGQALQQHLINQKEVQGNGSSGETETQRRASHQPLSIMQNRISSQMAYRCYSRQKDTRGPSAHSRQSRGQSRGARAGIQSSGQGMAGEGDLGPLPRALAKQQENNTSLIVVQQERDLQQRRVYPSQEPGNHRKGDAGEDPFETERQLIIARGGSLSRKVNHRPDDEDDIFNERGGFRININKEQKVVNHLEDRVENNNLLFYNFNAYKQDEGQDQQETGAGVNNNYGSSYKSNKDDYEAQRPQQRPYSRQSQQTNSRQDYRQRHIYSAASAALMGRKVQSRQRVGTNHQTHNNNKNQVGTISNNASNQSIQTVPPQQQLYSNEQNIESSVSASHDFVVLNQSSTAGNSNSDSNMNADKYINSQWNKAVGNNSNNNANNGSSNRYKQGSATNLHLEPQTQSHSAHRQEKLQPATNNLAVNVTSSGSLTTAATTKGSDFGNQVKGSNTILNQNSGSTTPQRGTYSIMKEVVVPPRPTNTSRAFQDQQQSNSSTRRHRGRGSGQQEKGQVPNHFETYQQVTTNKTAENNIEIESSSTNSDQHRGFDSYSLIKASQTSMGSNSFARSAMRLKQKSSRNSVPNRGGSFDGMTDQQLAAQPEQQQSASGLINRARRTAGGAMWSRMLNMQSVEEGIQEGNISSEDD